MTSYGMLRRVPLVRADVSEEPNASIITVTRIGDLGTMLAVTATDARCEECCEMYEYLKICYIQN
jgi:hypothetical protein